MCNNYDWITLSHRMTGEHKEIVFFDSIQKAYLVCVLEACSKWYWV
jgi:hypothetical protein